MFNSEIDLVFVEVVLFLEKQTFLILKKIEIYWNLLQLLNGEMILSVALFYYYYYTTNFYSTCNTPFDQLHLTYDNNRQSTKRLQI